MAYSKDYKIRVATHYLENNCIVSTANIFKVGVGTVWRWKVEFEKTGDIVRRIQNREHTRKITREKVQDFLASNPDGNQQEMAKAFGCTNQSVSDALKKFGYTRKKNKQYTLSVAP